MNDKELIGFALSPQQQRLLSLGAQPGVFPFVAQIRLLLEGAMDQQRLQQALDVVVARHEILRTQFVTQSGLKAVLQVVMPMGKVVLESLPSPSNRNPSEGVSGEIFDLTEGKVFGATLFQSTSEKHDLLLTLPALCADAASLKIIVRDLADAYANANPGDAHVGDVLQYADVAEHLNGLLQSEFGMMGKQYWHPQIKGIGPLPLYRSPKPPSSKEFRPDRVTAVFPAGPVEKGLSALGGGQYSSDLFLLACWQVLLQQLTGETELTIGYAADGRGSIELKECVGLFEKYLPLGISDSPRDSFRESCKRLRETLEEAGHWQASFQWPAEGIHHGACFSYYDARWTVTTNDLRIHCFGLNVCSDRFDLKLTCTAVASEIHIDLRYDSAAYTQAEARQMLSQSLVLVESASLSADLPISSLSAVGTEERRRLLYGCKDTALALELSAEDVHSRISGRARSASNAIAVAHGCAQLTYGELERRSNQLARYLQEQGVGPEVCVGLCMERGVEVIIGLLGILK
ncbi:MAG TPA: condensation domain-containing protein, partial [Candidatus Angelobacter sp.]